MNCTIKNIKIYNNLISWYNINKMIECCKIIAIVGVILLVNNYLRKYHIDKQGTINGNNKIKCVYDLGHEVLPEITNPFLKDIHDYTKHFIAIFPLLVALYYLPTNLKQKLLEDWAFLHIIRIISNNLTVLPSINKCRPTIFDKYSVGGCCDYMFSGHTFTSLLPSIYIAYYLRPVHPLWMFVYNILNSIIIIIGRRHYTDDVLIAWFITLFVFFIRTNNPSKVIKSMFGIISNL